MDNPSGKFESPIAGRYRLRREVGSGAAATVYEADDVKHHRRVAVKVLRPEIAVTIGVDRFVREIEIAARLTHPHILMLIDSGNAGGLPYYVTPFVDGESLHDRLERAKRLPLDETVRITKQVASALDYAHQRGVIHRDIKPDNILLSGDQAIVADFGIARALEVAGGDRLTGTGLVVGTPTYMSPEQAVGAPEVDGRSDVYALGCVVHTMVTGRPPFEARTPQALLSKHVVEPVPRIRATDPKVPVFVARAVERALAKDPDERFQTPAEFAEVLDTGTVVARGGWHPPHRAAVAVAAIATLLVVAGWLVASNRGPDIERLAVLPFVNHSGDSTQGYLVDGVHEALSNELAGLGLSVIARTSMMRYRNTDKSIPEIADELDADAVVEGSVSRQGNRLEIGASLLDPRTEERRWSQSYEGDIPNVNALYRGFAKAIAEEIRVAVSPDLAARLATPTAVNPETYEAYLRGMFHLNKGTPAHFDSALTYFHGAVAEDPADALSWAGLAIGYATLGHGPNPPTAVWQRAHEAAERAVKLDPSLAEAHFALADVKTYYEWDWEGAEAAFRRANELNPSLPMNHYHYAWYLALFDRLDEAIREHVLAKELDPFEPLHTAWLGGLYSMGGRYEEGLREARLAVEVDPRAPVGLLVLGIVHGDAGEFEDAVAVHQQALAKFGPLLEWPLGLSYARAGERARALVIARNLERAPNAWNAFGLASIYAALGDADPAFEWLDYEPRHGWVPWVRTLPWFAHLHDDPRFTALMDRMNLPPW